MIKKLTKDDLSKIDALYSDSLSNLTEGGVPDTRIKNALQAQAMVHKFIRADLPRDGKRAKVKGLVEGNAPYRQSDLVNAGRADACNVNWRIAESYLSAALGAFYDLFSEAPTFATVVLDAPEAAAKQKSQIATEEFQRLNESDESWDYHMQGSQHEMVLYGSGPIMFEDATDWRCKSLLHKNLLVPENAKSETSEWECCAVRKDYLSHQLYEFIRDPRAKEIGWDIEATKSAIMQAHPATRQGGQFMNWEWHQQQLKNSSYYYSAQSNKIYVAHLFFKEFPKEGQVTGRITHVIILENYGVEMDVETKFLFQSVGRFKNWKEVIHPLYYDRGGGGEHHSVTGMGVKLYSAMEYQNRLLCNLADKAFAPKMMFKPTSANGEQELSIANMGEYGMIPTGFDAVQMPSNPLMQDGMLFNRELTSLVASNLSQYRQNLSKDDGNPITATETNFRASEQARLGKTQLNRYYEQLDKVYAERYRRACNPNLTESMPGGKEALDFQERCKRRGVTVSDLQKVASVKATRVVGQGSPYMRQQSLEFLLGIVQTLPESGRQNLIQDVIATRAGQSSVQRYFPVSQTSEQPTEQNERAMNQVCNMKDGSPAVLCDTQNPVIFAQTYLQAATQAIQSLQQGGNPAQVLSFLDLCGPAIAAQLQRIAGDPTRKAVYDALSGQFKQVAKLTDQLKAKVQQAMQQQQQAQAEQQQPDMGQVVVVAKAKQDMALKQAKTSHAMQLKQETHDQALALKDASTAADIRRRNAAAKQQGNGEQ